MIGKQAKPEESSFLYRIGRAAQNIGLSIFAVVLTILLLEGGARVYRSFTMRSKADFRYSRPAPYQDAEYYSRAFVKESLAQSVDLFTPEGTRLVYPFDYEGQWFNVRDNLRVTTGQPNTFDHTIYVFGGSTVYCAEVPDEYTIPSQLQALINEADDQRWSGSRVENYGVTTINIAQEVERLKTVELQPGDIVIFYDGYNDMAQVIQENNPSPEGWIVGNNRDRIEQFSTSERMLFDAWMLFRDQSVLLDTALYPFTTQIPEHYNDPQRMAELAQALEINYANSIREAHEFTVEQGATFYHFVQPTILATETLSAYETSLLQNRYLVGSWTEVVYDTGYPALRQASETMQQEGVLSFDISEALNAPRAAGEEFFLDHIHIDDDGNRYIAEAIFEVLIQNPPK